jgi:cytochrome P450
MLGRDLLAGLPALARQYGDRIAFTIAGRHVVLLNHPDDVEVLLVKERNRTTKDEVTHRLSDVLGQGLLTSENPTWKRHRKQIAPSFQPRHLAQYGDIMVEVADHHLPVLDGAVDVHRHFTTAVTLDIVVRTVFGAEPSGEAGRVGEMLDSLMHAFETEQRTGWRFVPKWVPGAHRREVVEVTRSLDGIIDRLVAAGRERVAAGEASDDLLCRLLVAEDEQGIRLTDEEMRDELLTLFLAGHETTSLWLAFAMWLLAEHPGIQEQAHAEVDEHLGKRPATTGDLARLPFLGAVLDEALRLYPPAWAIGRAVTEDVPLDRPGAPLVTLRPGTQIICPQWVIHRDPRWWTGPDRFRPERWLNGETEGLPRMAYFPFGGGARICVGNHFARLEAVLVLATVLQHRQIRTVPGYEPDFIPSITLRTRNGVQLAVEAR